ERAGITCNKNGIPFDPEKPMITSGIRLGTPAGTSRGFTEEDFIQIGHWIGDVLDGLVNHPEDNSAEEQRVLGLVQELCNKYPLYR
ncbi:MAG: serine hydroxymethyltransferase, partial [Psychrobium sp.]